MEVRFSAVHCPRVPGRGTGLKLWVRNCIALDNRGAEMLKIYESVSSQDLAEFNSRSTQKKKFTNNSLLTNSCSKLFEYHEQDAANTYIRNQKFNDVLVPIGLLSG